MYTTALWFDNKHSVLLLTLCKLNEKRVRDLFFANVGVYS